MMFLHALRGALSVTSAFVTALEAAHNASDVLSVRLVLGLHASALSAPRHVALCWPQELPPAPLMPATARDRPRTYPHPLQGQRPSEPRSEGRTWVGGMAPPSIHGILLATSLNRSPPKAGG